MVTSRDIQEIVSKLSSDKAKAREEGIKLLNTWLEGERSIGFCKFLAQNTSRLKPDEIPTSETWPFLVKLLIQCVSLEISGSKRRLPKSIFAKTLRIVIQRAEDSKFSGKMPPLSPVVKTLFNHISDVLSNIASFQSEYGIIIRHLVAVRDYRFQMRRRIYCSLVLLYMEKLEIGFTERNSCQYSQKEEAFRNILTLHSLLENPPGDFPDSLREDMVKGFSRIFSHVRDEGKISRKLIESVNIFLLKDGPNLGSQSLELHNAMQQFVLQCWLTTHDRGLKDALIFYSRLQLNLTRGVADGSGVVEQLLDIVCRELDQSSSSSSGTSWADTKDDMLGMLSTSQFGLVELAAFLFYRACANVTRAPSFEKRARKEHAASRLKEALMEGKWLWTAVFCCLTRTYCTRISTSLFTYWFEGICVSFERILNDANMGHAYDGLLWTIRSLQELFFASSSGISLRTSLMSSVFEWGWRSIWSCLMHGLPIFSNITTVVDAALELLGYIISIDQINSYLVPQDVWDLRLFKRMPSMSVLYFIACYFSRKGPQGDLRDNLHLRRTLLQAILRSFSWKGSATLNEQNASLLPAAVYVLCVGFSPFTLCYRGHFPLHSNVDQNKNLDDWIKAEEIEREGGLKLFECSVETLTKIIGSTAEASPSQVHQPVRLPNQLREPLLHEMDICILGLLEDKEIERSLSEIFLTCALLSNLIYGSIMTRKREGVSSFISKLGLYLLEYLDLATKVVQGIENDIQSLGFLGSNSSSTEKTSIGASFKFFVSCPIFAKGRDQNVLDLAIYDAVIQSMEMLLKELAKLFEEQFLCVRNLQSEVVSFESTSLDSPVQISCPMDSHRSRILDMELDINEDINDVDVIAGGKVTVNTSFYACKWKLEMVALISSFFSVLHGLTWDILFNLMDKESDKLVYENMLYNLCQHPHWPSSAKITNLVNLINNLIERHASLKLDCYNILAAIHCLLGTLVSLTSDTAQKAIDDDFSLREGGTNQCLIRMGDMVNKVAESGLLDWFGRVKLIDCICDFVLLDPQIGETMIEKLLFILQDPDYRVRFFLSRRIGVLFQTWDGHEELFQDICSNFGVRLVVSSKEKLVTAKEVLAAGPQPRHGMETVIVTLMHLALHGERIELEAVFTMCVISAIDPCQRELVNAAVDNLSKELQYETRSKYLEELIAPILFHWVTCGVSLVALVEARQLFVSDAEPSHFMQYCCPWLVPALLLHEDDANLDWVAKLSGQPLTALVKDQFVPIISVCMALHCSNQSESERGAMVLQKKILRFAEISEDERDKLIKKHMVSIVSHILSLASCESEPAIPFFSLDTIARAVQTIVDGFLEMDDCPTSIGVVDKLNIFRADRVFMFIVEMHYKISAANHHRHKCRHLAAIEVLITVLGHRTAVVSTSNYLFNLIGQFVGSRRLREQCCRIISTLLKTLQSNSSKEVITVLGEQLQFLVSKLVACCIPPEANWETSGSGSSQVLSLLQQLTLGSDPSLYDYVRELEPFPEIGVFDRIRNFHHELCRAYSPRDHLLKFVKRSCYLPPRLFLWSLQALHKKLLTEKTFQRENSIEDVQGDANWHSDNEIVNAVWTLVCMCASNDAKSVRALVSDFISRVGIGDPHSVVFHLSGEAGHIYVCRSINCSIGAEMKVSMNTSIADELLTALLKLLKKYLMDDSVKVIDVTSQTLRGILSTERGQRALSSFDSYERSLIEVHSKGLNIEVVEKFLFDLHKKFKAEDVSLEKSAIWVTHDKAFETWICQLGYLLISYCDDVIIRLSQDIVMLKAEVAELLFSSIIVNLAGRKDMNIDLQQVLSSQVQEHIFTESNTMVKSIQVFLDALNELRSWHVMERSSGALKREGSKYAKPSSYSSRSRSSSAKVRNSADTSSAMSISMSTISWDKVYWLSIDYLVVAKSAVVSGSHFTSVMYVEHWCEEHFNRLTLGSPDFSHLEMLPNHVEILISAITKINEPDSLYGIIQSNKYSLQELKADLTSGTNTSASLEEEKLEVPFKPPLAFREAVIHADHVEQFPRNQLFYLMLLLKLLVSMMTALSYQIITLEHEGNWSKALEYYDLQVRSETMVQSNDGSGTLLPEQSQTSQLSVSTSEDETRLGKPFKGLIKSLQKIGCMHVLDLYCQGLTSKKGQFQHDLPFIELQYEAAWRVGNWDFSLLYMDNSPSAQQIEYNHFNENLHSCLRALKEGDSNEFHSKLKRTKEELVWSVSHVSEESTEFIYSTIIKLQILYHLGVAWNIRWMRSACERIKYCPDSQKLYVDPVIPSMDQLSWLNMDWNSILKQTQLHMNLLEPFIAFRRVLLQILNCEESTMQHLLQSASTLRKGSRFSQAAAALHEFNLLCVGHGGRYSASYCLGRLEEAKLLHAQGQHEMAISLAKYVSDNYQLNEEASDVYRLVGKWLAETRSSNSRTILEKYLKPAVSVAEGDKSTSKKSIERQNQTQFHLAHYADGLFRSYEERLSSTEWQAAMHLRRQKKMELEALIRRIKSSTKKDQTDYSLKIQELQKQLAMDKEEAEKLQDDRDNFLNLALEGYERCLVIGNKYDVRVVFRLVSLWFALSSRLNIIKNMLSTVEEVQSYKFIPLVYQIASRMGSSKDGVGPHSFQFALISLLKKMAIDHPYHTIFQLLALANGDRIKDKQRSRNSFIVDIDKKLAAEKLLEELLAYHGPIITQTKQLVEIYIKLAELETRREDTNKRITLPREIRSLRELELVPVITATFPVDPSCQYHEGSFPYFKGLSDSVVIMNGINAPKVVECLGSDGHKYKQLAKSGNDDLRQDAVMEQFFGLVNTFLQNHRDTWKRRLAVRTYKVVPFTPSAGVLEWVDGTLPLGEYLIGSMRNGGAHRRYGTGDWPFPKCREHMENGKDKRKIFQEVCENFRPVMHHFFLERFLQPADWFEKRLAYTRSVAASSMVGYIVGLGDRHAMNILIDQATAEVVHIDLGVAFEQGLMLKTPERVPFRLTRDIIDGMGVTGVDGVFRRCCEETLSVMRTNKEALLTIVEVFIHDPLYKWALSPLKALQRQKDSNDDLETSLESLQEESEGNKDAARALMRVKQKLDGYEEGEMRSVHGQVQQLIQDAIDPERLCQMFPGWGAWM